MNATTAAPVPAHRTSTPSAMLTQWLAPVGAAAATAVALTVVIFLGTTPVQDSDLWYHLAYARQILLTGQLTTDHTAFSWTPASNGIIYCAWLAQLTLHQLFEVGGLDGIFALRYAVLLLVLGSWIAAAWRRQVWTHPLAWVVVVTGAWTLTDAAALKPQLWSVVFLCVTVGLHLWCRERADRTPRWLFGWPALMLLWVNSHGGFVVGLAYQLSALAGEWITWRSGSRRPEDTRFLWTMLAATALSFAALLCTPYGVAYPLQFLSVTLPDAHLQAVRDYDSIFSLEQEGMRYVERGAILLLTVAVIAAGQLRRSRADWGVLIPAVVFAGFYASLVRLTGFLALVVVPGALHLLSSSRRSGALPASLRAPWSQGLGLALIVVVSVVEWRASAAAVPIASWRGLGNSYVNPEEEADYIQQHLPEARIGNDYNTGGYLLWRLWPKRQVFIDARYFPYIDWFDDYLAFEAGRDPGALVQRFQADVWVVHLGLTDVHAWFRQSSDWSPRFVGRSAVVFARRRSEAAVPPIEFTSHPESIRNVQQALWLMAFALDTGRRDVARQVVEGLTQSADHHDSPWVPRAQMLIDGLDAAARGASAEAVRHLTEVEPLFRGIASKTLSEAASAEAAALWQRDQWHEALRYARTARAASPQSPFARHNVAVMAWWIERQTTAATGDPWKAELAALAAEPLSTNTTLHRGVQQARAILAQSQQARPQVYVLQ